MTEFPADCRTHSEEKTVRTIRTALALTILCLLRVGLAAQFTDLQPFAAAEYSSLAWGDYDNDGWPDIAIQANRNSQDYTGIFLNNRDGTFADSGIMLPALSTGNITWVDFDTDGDMDIQLSGHIVNTYYFLLYRNDGGGVFTSLATALPGIYFGDVDWADFDGDGDPDVLLSGASASGYITRIYENTGGGNFTDLNAGLLGLSESSVEWGDLDGDGDLDIISTGLSSGGPRYTRIYVNNGAGVFTPVAHNLPQVSLGDVQLADFDSDGDLDVLLSGATTGINNQDPVSGVYRNDDNFNFTSLDLGLLGLKNSASLWCDLDGDGDLDFLLSGQNGPDRRIYCFSNDGDGSFSQQNVALPSVVAGEIAACDFDNDGDQDLLAGGYTGPDGHNQASVYRNETGFVFSRDIPPLRYITYKAGAWGDCDNDGDLDLAISYPFETTIYRNDGQGRMTELDTDLPYAAHGALDWGDYDNDGDLDLLLCGISDLIEDTRSCFILRNDGNGIFTDIDAGLFGLDYSAATWADYDNDGDADILICGQNLPDLYYTLLYRNDGDGVFTSVDHNIAPFRDGDAAWGDYNGDGFLDLAIGGTTTGLTETTKIYRNNGDGSFTPAVVPPNAQAPGTLDWEDFDGDGDIDLALVSAFYAVPCTRIFRNDGQDLFSEQGAGLRNLKEGCLAWADIDNDGDPDLLCSGETAENTLVLDININSGNGTFSPQSNFLRGPRRGRIDPGDFDGDGDLDFVVGGHTDDWAFSTILRNDTPNINTRPLAPATLNYSVENGRLLLSWTAGSDSETPANGLSYALRLGTSPNAIDIVAPLANADGSRLQHRRGYIGSNCSWSISVSSLPPADLYYWSVQTIDSAYQGSLFSAEQIINLSGADDVVVPAVTALNLTSLQPNPFSGNLKIKYALAQNSVFSLAVYNLRGQKIKTLAAGDGRSGNHEVAWASDDDSGDPVASGVYILRLKSGSDEVLGRILLQK